MHENLTVQRSSEGQLTFSAVSQKHQDASHPSHRLEGRESFLSPPQEGDKDISFTGKVSSQGWSGCI